MEFLKELFGGGPLTYEQLAQAAKDKGIQAVNAAGGAYVPKGDLDHAQGQVSTLTAQLGEANKTLEGYDPPGRTRRRRPKRSWRPSGLISPWSGRWRRPSPKMPRPSCLSWIGTS